MYLFSRLSRSRVLARTTYRALAICLAFLAVHASAQDATPPTVDDTEWLDARFADLASEDEERILSATRALADTGDRRLYPLLDGLFMGTVYTDPESERHHGLLLIGDEQTNDTGDSVVPVSTFWPTVEPILDASGAPVFRDVWDLLEVESGREIRAVVQDYRTLINLLDPEPKTRINAARFLAQGGDPASIPALQRARDREQDRIVRTVQSASMAQLRLLDPDPLERVNAAAEIADLNATEAIPALEARLEKNDETGDYVEADKRVRKAILISLSQLEHHRTFMGIVQTGFSGISLGSILILMALGLAIIYGLMGVINMAHGEFMMIGAYTAYLVQYGLMSLFPNADLNVVFFLSLPVSFLAAGLMGMLVEVTIVRHLYARPLESLLATWGLSLMMIQGARLLFGDNRAVTTPQMFMGGLAVTPQLTLPYSRLFIIGLTIATVLGMYILFYRTRFGTRIRAVTQNRDMSACLGIPTRRVNLVAFMLGTGIAGLAGCALTLIGNIVPNMGQAYIVDSFLVVVVGGVGKFIGTVLSGFGIGALTKGLEPALGAVYGKVFILLLVIIFLQRRPTGLFPAKGRHDD